MLLGISIRCLNLGERRQYPSTAIPRQTQIEDKNLVLKPIPFHL